MDSQSCCRDNKKLGKQEQKKLRPVGKVERYERKMEARTEVTEQKGERDRASEGQRRGRERQSERGKGEDEGTGDRGGGRQREVAQGTIMYNELEKRAKCKYSQINRHKNRTMWQASHQLYI